MGLEPTTSGVTGRRSNQLNYMAKCLIIIANGVLFVNTFFRISRKTFFL